MSAAAPLRAWRSLRARPLPLWQTASPHLATMHEWSNRRCVYTSTSLGEGSRVLKHIAEHSSRSFSKWTLEELLRLKDVSIDQRLRILEEVLHVGISKIVVLLQDLPLGFSATGPLRSVIQDYVQDVQDLLLVSPADPELFHKCIKRIFSRHRGMMSTIARGLEEFQEEITGSFASFGNVSRTKCPDVSESVPDMQRIEGTLDEFFTIRTTLRLLIAHTIQLNLDSSNGVSERERKVMHELLFRVPDSVREASRKIQTRHVGAICLDTRPSLVLVEAYRHVDFMCKRDLKRSCDLLVNGIPSEEYLAANSFNEDHFPYVDIHLYFVFFELLKNAMIASLSKVGPHGEAKPINASLIAGTSLVAENERSVKITDVGEGIRREDRMKVWSYFYSTRQAAAFSSDGPPRIDLEKSHEIGGWSGRDPTERERTPFERDSVMDPSSGALAHQDSSITSSLSDEESDEEEAVVVESSWPALRNSGEVLQDAMKKKSDAADLVRGQKQRKPLLSSLDGIDMMSDDGEEEAQTATPHQGHGLGLPVSRVLARYFDGEIEINSLPRKGTDVYVYL